MIYGHYLKLRNDESWEITFEKTELEHHPIHLAYSKKTTKLIQKNSFGTQRIITYYDAPRPVDQSITIAQYCEPAATSTDGVASRIHF